MKALIDVRVQIALGFLFFGIALLDSMMNGANKFIDFSLVGKISILFFMGILLYQVTRFLIIPIFNWIVSVIE